MASLLPDIIIALNAAITALLVLGFVAIRRGDRVLHPRLMKGAVALGVVFLVCYLVQVTVFGHARFPGEGWIRQVYLVVLVTHIALAICVPPLVLRVLYLALKDRGEDHRWIARITLPIWLYVSVTGMFIYWMNNPQR